MIQYNLTYQVAAVVEEIRCLRRMHQKKEAPNDNTCGQLLLVKMGGLASGLTWPLGIIIPSGDLVGITSPIPIYRLIIAALKPYEAIVVACKLAKMEKQKNAIHQGKFPQGIKHAALSKSYSVSDFERISSQKNLNLNQFVTDILAQTLRQYMELKNDKKTKSIRIAQQCIIRQKLMISGQYMLRNNLSMKITNLDLFKDQNSQDPQGESQIIKEAQGMHLLSKLSGLLPALLSKIISLDLSKKVSLVYSKYPQLKQAFTFNGKKSTGFIMLAPLLGGLNPTLSLMLHCDTLKLACLSDEACIDDPQMLMSLFDKTCTQHIESNALGPK